MPLGSDLILGPFNVAPRRQAHPRATPSNRKGFSVRWRGCTRACRACCPTAARLPRQSRAGCRARRAASRAIARAALRRGAQPAGHAAAGLDAEPACRSPRSSSPARRRSTCRRARSSSSRIITQFLLALAPYLDLHGGGRRGGRRAARSPRPRPCSAWRIPDRDRSARGRGSGRDWRGRSRCNGCRGRRSARAMRQRFSPGCTTMRPAPISSADELDALEGQLDAADHLALGVELIDPKLVQARRDRMAGPRPRAPAPSAPAHPPAPRRRAGCPHRRAPARPAGRRRRSGYRRSGRNRPRPCRAVGLRAGGRLVLARRRPAPAARAGRPARGVSTASAGAAAAAPAGASGTASTTEPSPSHAGCGRMRRARRQGQLLRRRARAAWSGSSTHSPRSSALARPSSRRHPSR